MRVFVIALIAAVFFILLQLIGFKAGTGISGAIAGGCAALLVSFFWPEEVGDEEE